MSDAVLVTGVSGYIGQHCAAELLRAGFRVRGSVRDAGRSERVRAAIAGVAPVDRLDFVELDLLADAGWDAAMAGYRYVLHVASPYATVEARQASAIIEPALQGTKRALAAARDAGVERVVVTSSVVAMNGHMTQGTFGPEDWTDLETTVLDMAESLRTPVEA